jgi:hypothetical protein
MMSDAKVCGICGDANDSTPVVPCIECLTPFHLRLRKDEPGKDCGDAILGDSMGIEMICNNCIEERRMGADPGSTMISMFAAMTEGRLVPPEPPRAPREPQTPPARPTRPAPAPAAEERPRRRFRRVDP